MSDAANVSSSSSSSSSPPPKRLKLDHQLALDPSVNALSTEESTCLRSLPESDNGNVERNVGITEYLNEGLEGFRGTLKTRYTDFMVNEIDQEGNVVHLRGWGLPKKEKKSEKAGKSKGNQTGRNNGHEQGVEESEKPDGEAEESLTFEISATDCELLATLVGQPILDGLLDAYKMVFNSPGQNSQPEPIVTPPVEDKSGRTEIHQAIRRIFKGKFETTTLDNAIKILPSDNSSRRQRRGPREAQANRRGQRNRAGKFNENGEKVDPYPDGQYLHFTLYKENRDTMDMVNLLARIMNLPRHLQNKTLSFAGTKDKRAVTVQRCAAFKIAPERLVKANHGCGKGMSLPRGCKVGDFEWKRDSLDLGDLKGNEFYITLRDARPQFTEESSSAPRLDSQEQKLRDIVGKAVTSLENNGFINYYGLQRFGTFVRGTHQVGVKMLQKDWKGAIDEIMDYDIRLAAQEEQLNISRDEYDRARACHIFATAMLNEGKDDYEEKLEEALKVIPRKFLAENVIIKATKERVGGNNRVDYFQILMQIPRGLRMMYTHSYQSYIWNHAVSERLKIYGRDKVVAGDLVTITKENKTCSDGNVDEAEWLSQDCAVEENEALEEEQFTRARPLSKEEADSGKYTFRDIILPTPGYDIVYPQNAIADVYKKLMAQDGLDPENMRRNIKEISMPGSYRSILGQVMGPVEWDIRRVCGLQQVIETDLERIQRTAQEMPKEEHSPEIATKCGAPYTGHSMEAAGEQESVSIVDGPPKPGLCPGEQEEEKLVVTLRLKLGTSMYATMALRELMKENGLQIYKAEFGHANKG